MGSSHWFNWRLGCCCSIHCDVHGLLHTIPSLLPLGKIRPRIQNLVTMEWNQVEDMEGVAHRILIEWVVYLVIVVVDPL